MSLFDNIGGAFNKLVQQAQAQVSAAVNLAAEAGRPLGNVARPLGNVASLVNPTNAAEAVQSVAPAFATVAAPVRAGAGAVAPAFATVSKVPANVSAAAAPAYAQVNSPTGSKIIAVAAPEYAWLTPGGREALVDVYGPAVTAAATVYGGPAAGAATGAAVTVAQGGKIQDAAPALVGAAGAAAGADPTATSVAVAAASGSREQVINAGLGAAGTEAGVPTSIITDPAHALMDGQPLNAAVQAQIDAAVAAHFAGLNLAIINPATSPVGLATSAAVAIGATQSLNDFEAAANAAADAIPMPDGDVSAIQQGLTTVLSGATSPPAPRAPTPAVPPIQSVASNAAAPKPKPPSEPPAPRATAPEQNPMGAVSALMSGAAHMTLNEAEAYATALAGHAEIPAGLTASPPIAATTGAAVAPVVSALPAHKSAEPQSVQTSNVPLMLALVGLGVVAVLVASKAKG